MKVAQLEELQRLLVQAENIINRDKEDLTDVVRNLSALKSAVYYALREAVWEEYLRREKL